MQKDKTQIRQNANPTKCKKTTHKYDKTQKDITRMWQYTKTSWGWAGQSSAKAGSSQDQNKFSIS